MSRSRTVLEFSNITHSSATWTISGLGNNFNSSYYIGCGISIYEVDKDGQSSPPRKIYSYEEAPYCNYDKIATGTVDGLTIDADPYHFYGFALALNGKYYPAGECYLVAELQQLPTPYLDTSKTDKREDSIYVEVDEVLGANIYYAMLNFDYDGVKTSRHGRFTFEDLEPDTTYIIQICCGGDGYKNSEWSKRYPVTTKKSNKRPRDWEWDTDFVRGASMTMISGNAVVLPFKEWNKFVDRIKDFRTYYEVKEGETLHRRSLNKVESDDPFTDTIYNDVRDAINDMSPSKDEKVPPSVSRGTIVTAYNFNQLRDSLNSIR